MSQQSYTDRIKEMLGATGKAGAPLDPTRHLTHPPTGAAPPPQAGRGPLSAAVEAHGDGLGGPHLGGPHQAGLGPGARSLPRESGKGAPTVELKGALFKSAAKGKPGGAGQPDWKTIGMSVIAVAMAIVCLSALWFAMVYLPEKERAAARIAMLEEQQKQAQTKIATLETNLATTSKLLAEQQAPKGGLILATSPEGATVTLGGEKVGQTPVEFGQIKPGKYALRVSKEGYEPFDATVEIEDGKFRDLGRITLARSSGSMAISSTPAGSDFQVRLGDRLVREGKTPALVEGIETGEYEVVVTRGEAESRVKMVVQRGQTVQHAPVFALGSVSIESVPAGAEVIRKGRTLGVTPLLVGEVPAGAISYELALRKYHRTTVTANVAPNQTVRVTATLAPNLGPAPGTPFTAGSGLEMIWLPAGYWTSKFEVTQGVYERVSGVNPSSSRGRNRPVENVSWNEAVNFCQRLTEFEESLDMLPRGFRYALPTDAQWEYLAADASAAGGSVTTGPVAATSEVGRSSPNRFGIFDARGNVWEWCQDATPGGQRVLRGGGWARIYNGVTPVTERTTAPVDERNANYGFRVVLAQGR